MPEIWIVDASPCILLAKTGYLNLLTQQAADVIVPTLVAEEILMGEATDAARQAIEAGWGTRQVAPPAPPQIAGFRLGAGETAVLTLVQQTPNSRAALDDGQGRAVARALGLAVIGTLGVIARAKKEGLIPQAAPVFHAVADAGLFLDDALAQAILTPLGEVWP